MGILNNAIFWFILIAIAVVLAVIGFIADKTDFNKKNKKEKKVDKAVSDKNAPSAWTGEIKKEDERKERVYKVASVDDWSSMPEVEKTPDKPTEAPQTESKGEEMFPDVTTNDMEVSAAPLEKAPDKPAEVQQPEESKPAEEIVTEKPLEAEQSPQPEVAKAEVQQPTVQA